MTANLGVLILSLAFSASAFTPEGVLAAPPGDAKQAAPASAPGKEKPEFPPFDEVMKDYEAVQTAETPKPLLLNQPRPTAQIQGVESAKKAGPQ